MLLPIAVGYLLILKVVPAPNDRSQTILGLEFEYRVCRMSTSTPLRPIGFVLNVELR